jgi:hypothetical protein
VETPSERRRRSDERRQVLDRRSGGDDAVVTSTIESAREHIRNAIQMFARVTTDEDRDPEWPEVADAVMHRLTRALAELDAGRV